MLVAFLEFPYHVQGVLHAFSGTEDAHIVEHDLLHRSANVEGIFLAVGMPDAIELRLGEAGRVVGQGLVIAAFGKLSCAQAGMFTEDNQVEQGIGTKPVGAMDRDTGALSGCI